MVYFKVPEGGPIPMETYRTCERGCCFKRTSKGNCPKYLRSIDEQGL